MSGELRVFVSSVQKELDHEIVRRLIGVAESRDADKLSSADLLSGASLRARVRDHARYSHPGFWLADGTGIGRETRARPLDRLCAGWKNLKC